MSVYSASLSSLGALVRRDSKPASPLETAPPRRTLDDIRNQVAHEVAMRAIATGKVHDGALFTPIPNAATNARGAQAYGSASASRFPNRPTKRSSARSAP